MKQTNIRDYPLDEVVKGAQARIDVGFNVYQKFTCTGCGARQTIDEANKFYTSGKCEECGTVTNIRVHGCNYMAVSR